jgi:hypothetical protein
MIWLEIRFERMYFTALFYISGTFYGIMFVFILRFSVAFIILFLLKVMTANNEMIIYDCFFQLASTRKQN